MLNTDTSGQWPSDVAPLRVTRNEIARAAVEQFINGKLEEDGENNHVVTLKQTAPRWVKDAVHKAHGDIFFDEETYSTARCAFQAIAEADANTNMGEIAAEFKQRTSSFTTDLIRWLASDSRRVGYCDVALRNGIKAKTIDGILRAGQEAELEQIVATIRVAVERQHYTQGR